MVSSRVITGVQPVFPYGSRAYSILYYGASKGKEFTTMEIRSCLRGKFPHEKGHEDFIAPAKRLEKAGCLTRLDMHLWKITEEGVRTMIQSVAYYQEFKIRNLGITYVNNVHTRIEGLAATSMSVMEMLDAEEKILTEVLDKLANRRRKKAS